MKIVRPGNLLSRRGLLRGSAVAPFVWSSGTRAQQAAANALPSETIKVGLIGCGGRGTGAAQQAILADDGVVLWAVADVFEERIPACLANLELEVGEAHGEQLLATPERQFSGFDAYEQLLDAGVDVVLLATPPHFRPQHLRAALDKGKHVFCEKPMAVDAPGVRSVLESIKIARAKQLSLVSGFCWRYRLSHRATWARIHDGAIGELQSVFTNYNTSTLGQVERQDGWSDIEWQLRNWKHVLWTSGDHLVEQACHSLDQMSWAFDDVPPLSCTAIGGRAGRTGPASGNIFDHFGLVYDYPNGAKGFHQARQIDGCSNENANYFWGTKGRCVVDGWAGRFDIQGQNPWFYEGPGNDMYQQEHDELFASIRNGEPINDGSFMANSTLVAIMGRMAAYTGQTITWEQAMQSEQRLGPTDYVWGDFAMNPVPVPGKTPFS